MGKKKINIEKSLGAEAKKEKKNKQKKKDESFLEKKKDGFVKRLSRAARDELVNSFSVDYYERNHSFEIPPDESTKELIAEDYRENIYRYEPVVLDKWKAEYFNSPRQMVRLQYHKYIAVFFAIMTFVMFVVFYRDFGPAAACILMLIAYGDFYCRYNNIALWHKPVPTIPVLSNLYLVSDTPPEDEDDKENEEDNIDDDFIQETQRQYVTPVVNVNNGFSSPATILTEWMNTTEKCTKQELVDNSGGLLDTNTVNLLLQDDANAWSNKETLDTISRLTYSSPKDWKQARRQWEDGE